MSLRVHHYCLAGSANVGDLLVIRSLRQSVERWFGKATFVELPVNERAQIPGLPIGLITENVERSNREADMVLVGGSNLLEPRKPRKANGRGPRLGRWGIQTDLDSIRRLRAPTLLVGMGTGSDYGKPIRSYLDPAKAEIRALHDHAFDAAVRDLQTSRRLAEIGASSVCTGCPVTFMTNKIVRPGDPNLPLIVSLPSPNLANHVTGKWFLKSFRDYVAWLERRRENFLVAVHDSRDLSLMHEWLPEGTKIFFSSAVDEIIDRYHACSGVVGFRLHSALLGLGLGKPVIPVGIDWRGLAFIETCSLQDLSIRTLRPGQFSKLRRLTQDLLSNDAELIRRLAASKQMLQDRYDRFFANAVRQFHRNTGVRRAA
ncbi:MAG: polysaccharide pyruvyl transferase family protein [Planctomycetota bacterium]